MSLDQVFRFEGPLTLATVAHWHAQACAALASGVRHFDFSATTAADSAALSLIFELMRAAGDRPLRLSALPAGLRSLAELYGVLELLPLVPEETA